MIILLQREI